MVEKQSCVLWTKTLHSEKLGSFIEYIKTDDVFKDIAECVETRFDTSSYQLDRPLPKGEN